jgi:hypothetical protein
MEKFGYRIRYDIPDPQHCSIGPFPAKKGYLQINGIGTQINVLHINQTFLKSTISLKLTQKSNKLVNGDCKKQILNFKYFTVQYNMYGMSINNVRLICFLFPEELTPNLDPDPG